MRVLRHDERLQLASFGVLLFFAAWRHLTAIRERFENPEGTMLGAPVRHAELAAPPKKPPKDEV